MFHEVTRPNSYLPSKASHLWGTFIRLSFYSCYKTEALTHLKPGAPTGMGWQWTSGLERTELVAGWFL